MKERRNTGNNNAQTRGNVRHAIQRRLRLASRHYAAAAKQKGKVAADYVWNAAKTIWRGALIGWRGGGKIIDWLDSHAGLLTALATVAVAFLTYYVAKFTSEQGQITGKQLKVMQGQLDEMQAARRPWIDVQTTIAGPLTFEPTPNLDLKIVLNNLGQSPALEAWPNVSMFLYSGGPNADTVKEIPKRCADLRKQEMARQVGTGGHAPGYLLFPGHNTELPRHAVLDTIRKVGLFPMHLLICGDYRFTYSAEQHSTDILYTLTTDQRLPDAPAIMTPGNWNVFIDSRFGKIESEHLKLYYEPFGDTYAY